MSHYFSVILFWIVVFAFIGASLYIGFKFVTDYGKSRIKAFKDLAEENGWQFDNVLFFSSLNEFANQLGEYEKDVFGKISSNPLMGTGKNVIWGKFNERNFAVFDQSYFYGDAVRTQTFFTVEVEDIDLPIFRLEPASLGEPLLNKRNEVLNKMNEVLNRNEPLKITQLDLNFYTHPIFSKDYWFYGQNEVEIRRLFTPAVLDFYDNKPLFTTIGAGKHLVIYEDERIYEPNQIVGRLKFLFRLVNLLKYGREN